MYIRKYCSYTSKGAILAKKLNGTTRDLAKKLVFEKGNANWTDELNSVTEKYKNAKHSITKLSPIRAFSKKKTRKLFEHKRSGQREANETKMEIRSSI